MRHFQWAAAAIALACAACSKETPKAPPTPVEAPSPSAVVETPTPAAVTPETSAQPATPEPAPAQTADAPPVPPPERVATVVPAKERRIRALLNNAISRDVTGATEQAAAVAEARRAACKTQACVDRSYAVQEAALRKWEGSEAIR